MNINILNNRSDIVNAAAEILVQHIAQSDRFVLGLGTGATVLSICEKLLTICQAKKISLKNVTAFLAGEYIGISHDHPSAYGRLLIDRFFSKTDISPKNIYSLNGQNPDIEAECLRYERALNDCGGLDFFLGSLGENGNLAFNEPGSALKSRTRLKTLNAETIRADARFFDGKEALVPTQALTMGLQTINDAKEVLIVVYGIQKAFAVQHCVEQPVCSEHPASVLQWHPQATMLVDKVAGRHLDKIWHEQK